MLSLRVIQVSLLWLLASTAVLAFSPSAQEILIDGRRIDLSTPLYQNEGVFWAPLRELADALRYDMVYLPKDAYYRLNHRESGQSCIVIENASEFWVEHVPYAFPQKTRRIDNQLYIPIGPFLTGLEWAFSQDGKGFHISTKTDTEALPTGYLRLTAYAPPADTELPFFEKDQTLSMTYRQKTVPIQARYQNTQLYLPLSALASVLGASVNIEGKTVALNFRNQVSPLHAVSFDNKWYISLAEWLQLTGTSPQWVPHTGTIVMWDQLRYLAAQPPNSLVIETTRALEVPSAVSHREELVVTLDAVIAPLTPLAYTFSTTHFRYFKIESTERGLRLRIGLKRDQSYAISRQGQGSSFKTTLAAAGSSTPTPKPKITQRPIRPAQLRAAGLENKRILIDAGHGGADPGAPSNTKEPAEKFFTLDISHRLKTLLEKRGAKVIMVREGDQNPSLQDRVVLAQLESADVFVSVHINSFFQDYANGTETFYYKSMDKPLARVIHQKLVNALRLKDLGLKENRLYVLRHSSMPAVLVEPCFISNPREQALLSDPNFRRRIAQALYDGLEAYFH